MEVISRVLLFFAVFFLLVSSLFCMTYAKQIWLVWEQPHFAVASINNTLFFSLFCMSFSMRV